MFLQNDEQAFWLLLGSRPSEEDPMAKSHRLASELVPFKVLQVRVLYLLCNFNLKYYSNKHAMGSLLLN